MDLNSSEASIGLAAQEFRSIIWNSNIYYRAYRSPLIVPILS
jgi:hypothetical protein